jgi:formylglycine-generating enzyme required for sulfatase activity
MKSEVMNMKRVFGVILVAAVLIAGCDFILGPDKPAGGGNLVIGFGESEGASLAAVSRGVVPTAEEQAALRYELVLTGPEDQKITVSLAPGQTFNQQVALGEWHIYAEAYNPENALIGTGTATVTVGAGKNEARVRMEPTPAYGISLSPSGTYTFPAAFAGYGAQTAHTVTINNIGNGATGALTAAITGTHSSFFTLSNTSINSIGVSGSDTFTVVPNTGLAEGTYTATVTVSGGNDISENFTVSFTVNLTPSYGISLSPSRTYIFPAAIVGYGEQTAHTVTINNIGNGATGVLTAGLSGADSGLFTLSATSINSIGVSGSDTFTVVPNTGLAEGTYTAMVTVSGGNDISENFTVSFTVNPIPGGAQSTHTINGVSVPFRYVPAGSFQRDDTATNIAIITNGYWMGETEVTQELFQAVMGANPSNFTSGADGGETQNRRPVEQVSWYEALAFCNKLSLADGKEPVYAVSGVNWATLVYSDIPTSDDAAWNAAAVDTDKNGYRLPTEMEWMWAAMGADKTVQPNVTGYNKAFAGSTGSNSIDDYAWYDSNSGNKTHEVGKKEANELGLRDMSGNIDEWCWDWYDSYPAGEHTDYTGAASGTNRMIRGGSCDGGASRCAVSYRIKFSPDGRGSDLGFRVVCP